MEFISIFHIRCRGNWAAGIGRPTVIFDFKCNGHANDAFWIEGIYSIKFDIGEIEAN